MCNIPGVWWIKLQNVSLRWVYYIALIFPFSSERHCVFWNCCLFKVCSRSARFAVTHAELCRNVTGCEATGWLNQWLRSLWVCARVGDAYSGDYIVDKIKRNHSNHAGLWFLLKRQLNTDVWHQSNYWNQWEEGLEMTLLLLMSLWWGLTPTLSGLTPPPFSFFLKTDRLFK